VPRQWNLVVAAILIEPKRAAQYIESVMSGELSKAVKKQLRELVYAAHEKALREPLASLGKQFDRWRRNEIDAIQIADLIREFDEETSREIYRRFTWSRNDDLPMLVAYTIHAGLLQESALSEEVIPAVRRWLSFYRDESSRGDRR
jgi:hypothetical protein